jgi:hypothetical protein
VNAAATDTLQAPNPVKGAILIAPENNTVHCVAHNHPPPAERAWNFFIAYDSVNTFIFVEFDFVV